MVNPVIEDDGCQNWYNADGQHHRDGGPAIIWADGDQLWLLNGYLHRADGPAMMWPSGGIAWYLNGINYSFNEWIEQVDVSDEAAVMMKLEYG